MFSFRCKDRKSILNFDALTLKPANLLEEFALTGYWMFGVLFSQLDPRNWLLDDKNRKLHGIRALSLARFAVDLIQFFQFAQGGF